VSDPSSLTKMAKVERGETVWKIGMGPETGVPKASERGRKGSAQPLLAAEVKLPRAFSYFPNSFERAFYEVRSKSSSHKGAP
jgi:hypothetical protein